MKFPLALIVPAIALLTGCRPSEAELQQTKSAETAARQKVQLDQKASELERLWDQTPSTAKQNRKALRKYEQRKANIEYFRKELARGRTRDVEEGLSDSPYWDLSYFQKLSNAVELHSAANKRLQELHPLVTSNDARALYHWTQAKEDLEAASRYGFSVDLIELASQEADFVEQLLTNKNAKPAEHSPIALRDRLFHSGENRAKLKARPFAHLEAAENCAKIHREAVGDDGWHEFLFELTEEYLQRATPSFTRANLRETRTTPLVDCFDDILDTRSDIDQNCPGNTEAKAAIAKADLRLKDFTKSLINLSHESRASYMPIIESIKTAREAIAKN